MKNLVKEMVHIPMSNFLINQRNTESIVVETKQKEIKFTV